MSQKDIPRRNNSDKADLSSPAGQKAIAIIPQKTKSLVHGRNPTFDAHSLEKRPPGEGLRVQPPESLLKMYPGCRLCAKCSYTVAPVSLLTGRAAWAE